MDKFVKVDRAITILVPPLEEGMQVVIGQNHTELAQLHFETVEGDPLRRTPEYIVRLANFVDALSSALQDFCADKLLDIFEVFIDAITPRGLQNSFLVHGFRDGEAACRGF